MSYRLVYHQTETSPAEYESDNPFSCSRCRFQGDLDDDTVIDAADGTICRECVHRCQECGILLEGESAESDLLLIDRMAYCELCVAGLLCPDLKVFD